MASKKKRAKFAHLQVGMTVYIHHVPNNAHGRRKHRRLYGKPLKIVGISGEGVTVSHWQDEHHDSWTRIKKAGVAETRLRWGLMHFLQLSTEGTAAALEFILKGEPR